MMILKVLLQLTMIFVICGILWDAVQQYFGLDFMEEDNLVYTAGFFSGVIAMVVVYLVSSL